MAAYSFGCIRHWHVSGVQLGCWGCYCAHLNDCVEEAQAVQHASEGLGVFDAVEERGVRDRVLQEAAHEVGTDTWQTKVQQQHHARQGQQLSIIITKKRRRRNRTSRASTSRINRNSDHGQKPRSIIQQVGRARGKWLAGTYPWEARSSS